ncbi:acyl-ACP--UDP-N-acetylglucosamine O-acyltransferase [Ferruginivarius sediminum]|uniref:Acyl-[acyl-carrier-protein]--UDP-N-acetylglucosamine O-acyltransferase n=1 Tax=Ferruginivarius sediminum TaxID=2661937 RepID=A0A369TA13_9PROT|nr:acyl-ACP--UDP-N-acetylglucosamine O-acyltransferase [Ferruginivarius sediminum]RDD62128.1 acyl-ACP--UDP-N-acetylglucosamine O-acyltransferase [Ferruginivarius sediminum]
MADVHPTAIVDPAARIGEGVSIGPYCVVGPDVELGDEVVLKSHVVVEGHSQVGARCRVYPFAAVGTPPQDMKYAGEVTRLVIGEGTVIREHVTLHPGTVGGGGITRVGRNCLLMIATHIAHDCIVGDRVVMANNATLGGHVTVGDDTLIGGLSAVHQFVRIGHGAMIGGMSGVEHDVIPFGLAMGNRARLNGLNVIGLKRRGMARTDLQTLRGAYQTLFEQDAPTFRERLDDVAARYGDVEAVSQVVEFIRTDADRALCHPQQGNAG